MPVSLTQFLQRNQCSGLRAVSRVFRSRPHCARATQPLYSATWAKTRFIRPTQGISISGQGGSASITSNRIQAKKPIVVEDPAVAPPTITRANATSVEGTCPVDGLIEIFVDPAQMAGQYVGQVLCLGSTWRYDGMLTDAYVTATLTTLDGTSVLAQHHSVR
jgi:hypothetical protein